MNPGFILGLCIIGIAAGLLSGMVGIGGGIVVVPALVFFFGFSQKMAQGTSLAMLLPPIGILSVLAYHRAGNVRWDVAGILIAAFLVGSYLGAKLVTKVNDQTVKKVFAVFMILVAIKYLVFDKPKPVSDPPPPTEVAANQ
ncbi:MAG: sulfite exporter TauE/SafE family protein [Sphingobacteriales bacterium]|nr:MAG: sulfite exporter TauE/SafE family protein [Sphingobacteriales bacterium]